MCVALPKSGKTSTVSKSRNAFFIWSQLGLVKNLLPELPNIAKCLLDGY